MALINPNTRAAPPIKPAINVGALLDIPTGSYVQGVRGESILNAGLGFLTGAVGKGNTFKSTISRYMTCVAMGRMSLESANETYDTEINVQENQLANHYMRIPELGYEDIIGNQRWKIVDGQVMKGEEWYREHKDFLRLKSKDKNNWLETPFADRDKKTHLRMLIPTFSMIDSFSEFRTSDVGEMNDKNDLGESGANTMHMRQGLSKIRLLMDVPELYASAYHYGILTAHIGRQNEMNNAGPAGQQPEKQLKHIKAGEKITGTTGKFTYVTHSCWYCYDTTPMLKDKKVEYPRSSEDDMEMDTDLNKVKIKNLRCKSGPAGIPMTIIVSQSEGVLPSLTEFHFVKETDRNFGIGGSDRNYYLHLLPEVTMMRTTVRGKFDENETLRRAMNITSELLQIREMWQHARQYTCSAKELYDDLKAMGYDWNVLLKTRGWWTTLENEYRFDPFLSTWDLLRMRVGEYIPFWFTPEQKKAIDLTKAQKLGANGFVPSHVRAQINAMFQSSLMQISAAEVESMIEV